jgi:hypothetical protein
MDDMNLLRKSVPYRQGTVNTQIETMLCLVIAVLGARSLRDMLGDRASLNRLDIRQGSTLDRN